MDLGEGLWGWYVLALRSWSPGSVIGVVTSPALEIDGTPVPVPDDIPGTMAEFHAGIADPNYFPAYIEVHCIPPRTT